MLIIAREPVEQKLQMFRKASIRHSTCINNHICTSSCQDLVFPGYI